MGFLIHAFDDWYTGVLLGYGIEGMCIIWDAIGGAADVPRDVKLFDVFGCDDNIPCERIFQRCICNCDVSLSDIDVCFIDKLTEYDI